MAVVIQGNGNLDFKKVRVHLMEVMVEYILDNGKTISCMAKENSHGQTEKNT
jgi:hypothetical protein